MASAGATSAGARAVAPSPADAETHPHRMSNAQRVSNLFGVGLPFAAFIAAIVLLWNDVVGWRDLAIMLGLYMFTGLGIAVGYHRLLTHRSFKTSRTLRAILAIIGSLGVEGGAITWTADHRKHHAFTDEEGDPHSPHVGHRPGVLGAIGGLWHAHIGWLFSGHGRADPERFAADLVKAPELRMIERMFLPLVAISLAIPFGLGWLLGGTLVAALTALLWGGLVRIFLLHHITWSINSVCHFFGTRRFATEDESRNVFWLALPSFGEAWHHNHHTFPTSAFHGLRRWEIDVAGLVIRALEKLGLIWDVVRIPPEKQSAKAIAAQR